MVVDSYNMHTRSLTNSLTRPLIQMLADLRKERDLLLDENKLILEKLKIAEISKDRLTDNLTEKTK